MGTRYLPSALAVGALVLAVGCAQQDPAGLPTVDGGAEAPSDAAVGSEEQWVAYEECVREQGVDLPEEGTGQLDDLDVDQEALEAAMDACEDLMPTGEMDVPQEVVEDIREWAVCMRGQGVDVPDPDPDGRLDLDDLDVTSDEFDAADAQC